MCYVRTIGGLSSQATVLYDEQYDLHHRVGFAIGERSVLLGRVDSALLHAPEPPFVQGAPMASTSMEEAWVVHIPTGKGSFRGVELVNTEPIMVTLEELLTIAFKALVPITVQPRGSVPCIYINL